MSQWIITYSRDEAAEVLKVKSKEKPSLEPVSYTHLTLPTTPYV